MMRAMFARSKSPQRAPSPTFSEATNASAVNFGLDGPQKIITRANLKASLQAYEQVRPFGPCCLHLTSPAHGHLRCLQNGPCQHVQCYRCFR